MHTIMSLNYLAVLGTAIAGFVLSCLWLHGPLFGKAWMAEMKFTKESMEAAMAERGMAKFFVTGLAYTLFGTFGLAVLLKAHGSENWLKGAEFGLFVGGFVVSMRLLHGNMWEKQSLKLQAINVGHELALFTLQGALFGVWH